MKPQADQSSRHGRRRSLIAVLFFTALLLGIAWRVIRYGLNLQIYPDDAYLLNNVLVKSYRQLLEPLANTQVAAPAFLWIEKFIHALWPGDWGVRLWPLIAGLGSLALMAVLARKLLRPTAGWIALAILAVSEAAATYSAHAKPYTTDLLLSLTLTLLAVVFLRRRRSPWLLAALGLSAALFAWGSYTSLFVSAGLGLTLTAYACARRKSLPWTVWPALVFFAAAPLASLALLYRWNLEAGLVSDSAKKMHEFWSNGGAFPPVRHPFKLIWWLVDTHTGLMYAYPQGAKHLACTGQFILWLLGIRGLWRSGRRWETAALLAPQGLLLIAALLGLYPYGDNARISLFLAPAFCIFIAQGVAELAGFFARSGQRRTLAAAAVILIAAGLFGIGSELWTKFKREKEPTIRTLLARTSRQCGPADRIVALDPPAPLAGGGSTKQIFEYYMLTAVRPSVVPSDKLPTDTPPPGHKIFLIDYVDLAGAVVANTAPIESNGKDDKVAAFEHAPGRRLRLISIHKSAALYRERGSVLVFEYEVLAPPD